MEDRALEYELLDEHHGLLRRERRPAVPGDYDGDNRIDIAVYRPATRQWLIRYSASNYTTGSTITWGAKTDIPVPGDYDGDAITDVAVYHPSTGQWQILLSSTGYASGSTVTLGSGSDIPFPATMTATGRRTSRSSIAAPRSGRL
jgi:hypothetical protein